ncbi:uncharacterized protein METZ01_LOCUS154349, partial [marine metagenome]
FGNCRGSECERSQAGGSLRMLEEILTYQK